MKENPPTLEQRPDAIQGAATTCTTTTGADGVARALADAVLAEAVVAGSTPDPVAVDLTREMAAMFARDLAVFLRKQMDYGPGNISAFGVHGVLLRSHDKTERAGTLLRLAVAGGAAIRAAVRGEAVDDTLGDLTNYGAIGRLVVEGKWPEFVEGGAPCP